MAKMVADQFAETLAAAGVKRIYGIVGDSLNGLTDSIRRQGKIEWIHVRHEEVAAFAAGAEAHLTGVLAVCAGSCGPGNLHLINGLYDCHRSRVPVLAIAAQIPSAEIGSGYFQETHPQNLFKECSHYCELISGANQMPRVLEVAIREATAKRGVSVVVMPGDVALQPASDAPLAKVAGLLPAAPVVTPATQGLERLAALLNGKNRVTLLCGSGCQGAHEELLALAERLKAPMVHTMRGKEHVEWDNPYDVGMTGLIGFSSGYYAMLDCDVSADARHRFPLSAILSARFGRTHRPGRYPGRRTSGAVRRSISASWATSERRSRRCCRCLQQNREATASGAGAGALCEGAQRARRSGRRQTRQGADPPAADRQGDQRPCRNGRGLYLRCRPADGVGRALSGDERQAAARSAPSGTARWPMRWRKAIGAQAAFPGRQVISLSGDGGFTMLMGDFLSLVQLGLPVKVVVFNNGALGFIELEQKSTGFLPFGTEFKNPNFAAMAEAVGVRGIRLRTRPRSRRASPPRSPMTGRCWSMPWSTAPSWRCRRRSPRRWRRASRSTW